MEDLVVVNDTGSSRPPHVGREGYHLSLAHATEWQSGSIQIVDKVVKEQAKKSSCPGSASAPSPVLRSWERSGLSAKVPSRPWSLRGSCLRY